MRAVIQRVHEASVTVDGKRVGSIQTGLLVLIGVEHQDDERDAITLVEKVVGLRCFEDNDSKFNLSIRDVGGHLLVISQFTLLGDCRKGRRPSFSEAARPEHAVPLYERVIQGFRAENLQVETGVFGAHMDVQLINNGPVTLLIDTKKVF